MKKFPGFPEGSKLSATAFPAQFFSELLPMIDDLAELKLTLFCFWALSQKEGRFRYLCESDWQHPNLLESLHTVTPTMEVQAVRTAALKAALKRGTLIKVNVEMESRQETLYFVNTALGRTAVAQIKAGAWQPGNIAPVEILPERLNIYALYEANIGLLTPHIADALKDAEQEYPLNWIEEAIRAAAELNKHSWRYIDSILKRWEREGRSRDEVRRVSEANGVEYLAGQFADFIER
jgi:DnaD/phage-associated family protein